MLCFNLCHTWGCMEIGWFWLSQKVSAWFQSLFLKLMWIKLNFIFRFVDVTAGYLQETRAHRYERAVPPEEDSLLPLTKVNAEAIDQYAFGILVEELLRKKTNDEIPCLLEFRDFCKKKLTNSDPGQRSKLSEILKHPFFNHEFIRIHRFLMELPLRANHEKEQFFRSVWSCRLLMSHWKILLNCSFNFLTGIWQSNCICFLKEL